MHGGEPKLQLAVFLVILIEQALKAREYIVVGNLTGLKLAVIKPLAII